VSAVGHDIDVTLSDLVADLRAVTPTAAAEQVFPSVDELRGEVGRVAQMLQQRMMARLNSARSRLAAVADRRVLTHPRESILMSWRRVDQLEERLLRAVRANYRQNEQLVNARAAQLDSLSPLAVLSRGYSLTQSQKNGEVITSITQVRPDDQIRTRLADGELLSRVELTQEDTRGEEENSE